MLPRSLPRAQITCVSKPDRMNRHEHIYSVGYIDPATNTPMKCTQEYAIAQSGVTMQFFVKVGLNESNVNVSLSPYGNLELRTSPDKTRNDNLLSLPECSWSK